MMRVSQLKICDRTWAIDEARDMQFAVRDIAGREAA